MYKKAATTFSAVRSSLRLPPVDCASSGHVFEVAEGVKHGNYVPAIAVILGIVRRSMLSLCPVFLLFCLSISCNFQMLKLLTQGVLKYKKEMEGL